MWVSTIRLKPYPSIKRPAVAEQTGNNLSASERSFSASATAEDYEFSFPPLRA